MLPSGPHTLNAYITAKCNNRCEFCTGRGQSLATRDFSVDVLSATLEAFPTIHSVCLAGLGEPLLSEELGPVAEACLDRGLYTSLITNGSLVLDRPELPYARFGYVSVSLNEIDPYLYELRFGSRHLDRIVVGLDHLLSAGAQAGVSFVIGQGNAKRVTDYLGWAKARGVKFVSLVNTLPQPGTGYPGFWQEVLLKRFTPVIAGWMNIASAMGVNVNAWPRPIAETGSPAICRSAFETIGVDGDGNVSGCQRLLGPQPEFGNVLRDGASCWHSDHFEHLRTDMTPECIHPPCTECFGSW